MFRAILLITVSQWACARFPAAAIVATRKCPNGMDELMVWVCFPLRRFPSARDHYARPILRHGALSLDRSREMHEEAHRSKDALRVVNQSNQLPGIRLASQIHYVVERWVMV